MATNPETLNVSPAERLIQLARSRMPFNPLDGMDITGANVARLQKSMATFSWTDPRFISREQAQALGWKVAPKAESVELQFRNPSDGSLDRVTVFNAQNIKGMPSLEAMLAMTEMEFAALRSAADLGQQASEEVLIGPARQLAIASQSPDGHEQAKTTDLAPGFYRLVGRGSAPYMNDANNTMSYYAELQDANGAQHKLWGVDIDRSLDAAQAQIGDAVSMHRDGHRTVEIDVRENDGSIVRKPFERANWVTTIQPPELVHEQTKALPSVPEPGTGANASIDSVAPEQEVDTRFAVLAPYWRNGLHNHEGVALAEQINAAIKANKLSEDKEAIASLLAIYPKAKQLGVAVVPERQYLNDPALKANAAHPSMLLDGDLVRDKEGMYRPAAGGRPLLHDKDDSIVLKDKDRDAYRGAMELAIAKGWTAIELKGKPAMLSNAWLEAKMMGLDVVNYAPTEKDLANYQARVAEESKRKAAQAAAAQQSPEMVEVRPFIDANGQQKTATVTYTVTANAVNDATFDNPREAAKAYASLAPTGFAAVVRTVTRADGEVREDVVAGAVRSTNPRLVAQSLESVVDREFDEALANVEAEHESPVAVTTGTHVGPIVAVDGNRFAQKSGRDPSKLVWHDMSNLNGTAPALGEMAEIKYRKGQGQIKARAKQKELEGVDAGMER